MAAIRARQLADGSWRWDVNYSVDGRATSVTFDDPADAESHAHVASLRKRRCWPLAPLADRTGMTVRQLAQANGLTREHGTWLARQGLTDVQADQWATAEGLHPVHVWGWDWVTAALPPTSTDGEAVA